MSVSTGNTRAAPTFQRSWPGGISKVRLPIESNLTSRSSLSGASAKTKPISERSEKPLPSPASLL